MDLVQFSLITVFSIFLAGTSAATSWGSNELDRREGYDLQRGPVFYEAYYPDDQGTPASNQEQSRMNPQTARQYFDQARVLEKTYQAFEDPRNVGYERTSKHSEEALYPDSQTSRNILRNRDQGTPASNQEPSPINPQTARQYFDQARVLEKTYQAFEDPRNVAYERTSKHSEEALYPGSHTSRNTLRNSDQAYEVARQLKRFVEGLEQDPSPRDDLHTSNFENPRRSYNNPYKRMDSGPTIPNENYHSDRRLDEAINIILSAVKKEALELSKERQKDMSSLTEDDVRISRQQRFVESEDLIERPEREMKKIQGHFDTVARSARPGVELPGMEIQGEDRFADKRRYPSYDDKTNRDGNFEDNYQEVRRPVSQMRLVHMENIFQPRPQVINYVFSPSRTTTEGTSMDGPAESKSIELHDQPLGQYRDNLIVKGMKKKVETSDGLGIASIEVSEMPRHKHRHHHGEKPRRNHQHHPNAKTDQ